MVIGSPASLQALAREIAVHADLPISNNTTWPPAIANAELGTDARPFKLSFHVETSRSVPATNVARPTRGFWAILIMLPFALIGAISVLGWAGRAF